MIKLRTDKENLEKVRNDIGYRLMMFRADILYHTKKAAEFEDNTQDKIDSLKNLERVKNNVKNDTLYLECIDELLEEYNGNS